MTMRKDFRHCIHANHYIYNRHNKKQNKQVDAPDQHLVQNGRCHECGHGVGTSIVMANLLEFHFFASFWCPPLSHVTGW